MFESLPPVRDVALRARRPLAAVVAVVVIGSVGVSSTPSIVSVSDAELPVAPGDRVLQSVDVAMAPDGTLTAVEGTTVTASADGESSDGTSQAYAPGDVVDDLPVRVLTSYRTADGSGTDLSDLAGHDGEVRIDLTVENLTVRADELSYDVGGASRERSALVGAPLTVVASADLGSLQPDRVVTQSAGREDVTNGVLSRGANGSTQVQWATILAPPQLASSATLSLVVDAEDLTTPAFDLSVQPGLVTDPSVGALVKRAFDPAASEEMELQARTVEVVGEVNEVLGEAGDSISQVRRSLGSTTETLGERTVADLETGIVQIAASMESLGGTVDSLGTSISGAVEATGSSSLAQLESTVSSIDTLLGDTSRRPGTAPVTGRGCETTVQTGAGGGSVYDSLLRVAGTLNGYAEASDLCKVALQDSLLRSIGPADVEDCPDSASSTSATAPASSGTALPAGAADSVTCVLARTGRELPAQIAESLEESEVLALGTLESNGIARVIMQMNELNRVLDGVEGTPGLLAALRTLRGGGADGVDLEAVREEVEDLGDLGSAFEGVLDGLDEGARDTFEELDAIASRDQQVYTVLCTIAANAAEPVAAGQALAAAELIVERTPCTEPPPYTLPSSPQVQAARTELTGFVEGTRSGLRTAVDAYDAQYAETIEVLETVTRGEGTQKGLLRDFFEQIDQLNDERLDVKAEVDDLDEKQEAATQAIVDAFDEAATKADDAVRTGTEDSIRKVSRRSAEARAEVAEAFTRSKSGMRAAASGIAAGGRGAIEEQKAGLTRTGRAAAAEIGATVRSGLNTISDSVSASTRDTDVAGRLLTADLGKVLLDLGDPEVAGAGLLGTLGATTGDARAANFQVALATRTATSYANARGQDVGGLLLRQAQAEAAFGRLARLEAFQVDVPDGVEHRTVYTFHLASGT